MLSWQLWLKREYGKREEGCVGGGGGVKKNNNEDYLTDCRSSKFSVMTPGRVSLLWIHKTSFRRTRDKISVRTLKDHTLSPNTYA